MTEWGRVAIRVDQAHEALGHRSFEVAGAVFVKNPELPDIHVANYGHSVTASSPGEIDGLLALAEREFAGCAGRAQLYAARRDHDRAVGKHRATT